MSEAVTAAPATGCLDVTDVCLIVLSGRCHVPQNCSVLPAAEQRVHQKLARLLARRAEGESINPEGATAVRSPPLNPHARAPFYCCFLAQFEASLQHSHAATPSSQSTTDWTDPRRSAARCEPCHHHNTLQHQPATTPDATQVILCVQIGAGPDVEKAEASKAVRRGKGKMRNRRYVSRRGPLIIYAGTAEESDGFVRALRNIPGVDTCHVERLNLLQARAYFLQMCLAVLRVQCGSVSRSAAVQKRCTSELFEWRCVRLARAAV